jgi:hypothetical protein
MTDRFHSITVVLERDIREDDAQTVISAILALRGVISATGAVADMTSHMAEQRARNEIAAKLWDVLYPKNPS